MPAGSTYTPIATTTLGSAQSTVTFSSISGSYTDLVLIATAQQTLDSPTYLRINGSSSSIYSTTGVYGNGSTTTSLRFRATGDGVDGEGIWAPSQALPESTSFGVIKYNLQNYSNTTTNKTVLVRYDNASAITGANVGLIQTTSAITSITLRMSNASANFATGSTFTLYGIASA